MEAAQYIVPLWVKCRSRGPPESSGLGIEEAVAIGFGFNQVDRAGVLARVVIEGRDTVDKALRSRALTR
jgi:hypothetical protein